MILSPIKHCTKYIAVAVAAIAYSMLIVAYFWVTFLYAKAKQVGLVWIPGPLSQRR